MKRYPLLVQIWIVFGMTLIFLVIVTLIIPLIMRTVALPEIHTIIEASQETLLEYELHDRISNIDKERRLQIKSPSNEREDSIPRPIHIFLFENGDVVHGPPHIDIDISLIKEEALNQKIDIQRYDKTIDSKKLYYVIRKTNLEDGKGYLVSYVWIQQPVRLFKSIFRRFNYAMIVILILSLIPSAWLARYLTKPLIQLEKDVKRIADKNWYEPIHSDRYDEIGKLINSIEVMRNRLVQQDKTQQTFLQNISHELKTPTMLIRSYTQAIQDGIYPKGTVESSIKVIEEEAERLEKRIRDLLNLTKLEYTSTHQPSIQKIELSDLIESVIDRFRWKRIDLSWKIDLIPLSIKGNYSQWETVIENLLDNQVKYANNKISILLYYEESDREKIILKIWNDGTEIPEEIMATLFDTFQKGNNGDFGLGLSIVYRILKLHQSEIWANNENKGVAFYLKIPIS